MSTSHTHLSPYSSFVYRGTHLGRQQAFGRTVPCPALPASVWLGSSLERGEDLLGETLQDFVVVGWLATLGSMEKNTCKMYTLYTKLYII